VRYAVFGCGNTEWATTYQLVPTAIDDGLHALGGQRLLVRHEGNSAADIEGAFSAWLQDLWPAVAKECELRLEQAAAQISLMDVEVLLGWGPTSPLVMAYEGASGPSCKLTRSKSLLGSQLFTVAKNCELRKEGSEGSTRHIELQLPVDQTYTAGDHLMVHPENDEELVTTLLQHLQLPPATCIRLAQADATALDMGGSTHVPILLSEYLRRAVDIGKPITNERHMAHLADMAEEPFEKIQLGALKEQKVKLSLVDILERFGSVKPTLSEVLTVLPAMKPRLYSISSSPLVLPSCVSLTCGLVRFFSTTGRQHNGVCSSYLARCSPGEKVWAVVRDTGSSFRLPASLDTPLVLVGPGTGLAPLRGFVQELHQRQINGVELPTSTHLFFGCRTEKDFLYEDELRQMETRGVLTGLHVALSREGEKQYVQHMMPSQAAALWETLRQGGHVFVCGDASRMAPDVRSTLKKVVQMAGELTEGAAESYIEEICVPGPNQRYHEDVWAGNA